LFRSFHSLKGIAGMVDHRETEALAHELESYLRALREGDAILTATGMDLLIKGAGALEASIAARRANQTARDTDPIVGEIQALIEQDGPAQAAPSPEARGQGNWLVRVSRRHPA
jgi:two-component system chemotaxis sensor kinase CheA